MSKINFTLQQHTDLLQHESYIPAKDSLSILSKKLSLWYRESR